MALVKEEYNRSAFDSEDTTPENEVNQDIIDDENVENSWIIELNWMTTAFPHIVSATKIQFIKKKM